MTKNPFDNVPFNTKKSFVYGVTKEGTEIYLPVDSDDHAFAVKSRDELQDWLNKQPSIDDKEFSQF
jgi:hypothetical protein